MKRTDLLNLLSYCNQFHNLLNQKGNKMEIIKTISGVEFNDNNGKLVEVNDAETLNHYTKTLGLTFDFFNGLISKQDENNQPVECGFITEGQDITLTFELDEMDADILQAIQYKTHKRDMIFYDFSNRTAYRLAPNGEYMCLGEFTYRFMGAN